MGIPATLARPETTYNGSTRECARCGVDFDASLYIVGAPCLDCQEVLADLGDDQRDWFRRTRLVPGEERNGRSHSHKIVYRDPKLAVRTLAEYEQLRRGVIQLHADGKSTFVIAWTLDVTDMWVRRALRRAGLTPHLPFYAAPREWADTRTSLATAA